MIFSNILVIMHISNAAITSKIKCCLTNSVEIIINDDIVMIINLLFIGYLALIYENITWKQNKQCRDGKQLRGGLSKKKVIFITRFVSGS